MIEPTHLDVEGPKFRDKPHAWIQWKGTQVCADINCSCGEQSHFDGEFMYFIRCPHCGKVWEVGTHVTLHDLALASPERLKHAIERAETAQP